MIVTSISGSIPTKRVGLAEVPTTATDDDILEVALKAGRETRSSLFGWHINRDDRGGFANVSLHTD